MSARGRRCAVCGATIRADNVCEKCLNEAAQRSARRKAEKAILHEFAMAAFATPCSDGDCMLGHPGGMHTNGGCRCGRYLEGGAQVIWLGRVRGMLAAMASEIREARATARTVGQ